jgi:hypothetical protein
MDTQPSGDPFRIYLLHRPSTHGRSNCNRTMSSDSSLMPAKPFLLPENALPAFHLRDQLAKTGVLKRIGEENVLLPRRSLAPR